jgi:excisionase family DNA binding protein
MQEDALAAGDLLTVDEVAAILRVHAQTVRRWIAAGDLRAHRPGKRSMRIARRDLDRFLADSAGREQAPEALVVVAS